MPAIATPLAECRDISLGNDSNQALYQQLYHAIRTRILSRRLTVGQRLPASRELAKELNVSRNTVQLALSQLVVEGYLETKAGSGVFVSAQIPDDYQKVINTKPRQKVSNEKIHKPSLSDFAQNSLQSTDPEPLSYKPFAPGMPDLDAFPKNLWLKLWHKHLRNNPLTLIENNFSSGLLQLKQVLCDYLRYSRAVNCKPNQIIITQGAAQALDLVSRILINPGDTAIIEEPGYLGIRRVLQALGANLITCPVNEEGLKVNELPHRTKQAIKLVYTTPTHQYPLGGVMPISHRLQLLEWASKQNSYIIEDDYDSEFHYTSKPLPSLQNLDKEQRVLYVGSFSKVLTPFLRLGYLVIPENLVSLFEKIKWMISDSTEPVKQSVVAEFIESGHFGRHLKRMRHSYSQKMQWIVDEAEKQLSQWLHIGAKGAGMHLVVTFKNEFNDQKLVELLKQKNIACKALSGYYLYEPKKNGLILGFAHMQKDEIIQGISIIRQSVIEILSTKYKSNVMIELNKNIHFTKVKTNNKNTILNWFSEKHVSEFYYGEGLQNTLRNLDLYCQGINDNGRYTFDHWIAFYEEIPFGFLMTSPITGPYDPNDDYNKWYVDGKQTFTLDLLIGAKEFLGKGLAHRMIQAFILNKFSDADYFIIDPAKSNPKAIHVYKKAGFKKVGEFCPAYDPIPHIMMRLRVKDLKNE